MINRRVSLLYRYPLKAFHHMVCPCTLDGVCVVCPGTSELVGQQEKVLVQSWPLTPFNLMPQKNTLNFIPVPEARRRKTPGCIGTRALPPCETSEESQLELKLMLSFMSVLSHQDVSRSHSPEPAALDQFSRICQCTIKAQRKSNQTLCD